MDLVRAGVAAAMSPWASRGEWGIEDPFMGRGEPLLLVACLD